jgi:hypothetical protein
MSHDHLVKALPMFCTDIMSIMNQGMPVHVPEFTLRHFYGLCANFTDWCQCADSKIVPSFISEDDSEDFLQQLFTAEGFHGRLPFNLYTQEYFDVIDKYNPNDKRNIARLKWIKEHANA